MSDKVPTLEDVAREAGVSIATASRVLRGYPQVAAETRIRVLREARRLGYQRTPANLQLEARRASSSSAPSSIPGLNRLVVLADSQGEQHFIRMLVELLQIGTSRRFEIVIERYQHGTLSPRVKELQAQGYDAVVVLAMEIFTPDDVRDYPEFLIPVILINRYVQGLTYSVTLDDYAAGCHAARYLYGLGHRRIAYLEGDMRSSSLRDRADGFKAELCRLGVYDPSYFVETGGRSPGFHQRVAECIKSLLDRDEPVTAVWAWNDAAAWAAIAAAHALGARVPEDISIMGFDRMRDDSQWVLTTFDFRFRELAHATVALLQMIFSRSVNQPIRISVTPTLIEGHTTGPAPQSASDGRRIRVD